VPKVTRKCHPFGKLKASSEAKPKDLVNEKEILRFAQNDSFVVTLVHFSSLYPLASRMRKSPKYHFPCG